jgi:hypothetical protein
MQERFCHSAEQAQARCSRGGSCPLAIVRTAHQRPRDGQQGVPHLLQQCAVALDLGVAPGQQLGVEPRPDVVFERLLDDGSR